MTSVILSSHVNNKNMPGKLKNCPKYLNKKWCFKRDFTFP